MDYKVTPQSGKSYIHMWDVASTKVFDGGFLFDLSCVPAGTEKLPKGVFLKIDLVERKAVMIKTAVLYAALTAIAVAVKINKNALLIETDVIGIADKYVTVGVIDTTNADYDSITIVADSLGVVALGDVLQSYTAEGVAIAPSGFNTTETLLDAQPSVDVFWTVEGIVPTALPNGVTAAIVASLPHCQFLM